MKKTDDNLKYKIALCLIPNIGPVTAKNLIAYTGSVTAPFKETKPSLMKIPGVGEFGANQILKHKTSALIKADSEIKFIEKHQIETIFYLDNNYPKLLKHCNDAPLILFGKGNFNFNEKIISIIGTRKATPAGKENCERLIYDLKKLGHNPVIISGLAYGIDICAHKAALKNKLQTVAVLGHGLDRIYPSVHKDVAREILLQGSILTEYMSYSLYERQNFLQRNRIIAGMSSAVVVIESAARGGSLTTASIANSYNREVFAFPGRISDKYSEGCNKLIKQNKACLIESAKDIEYILGWKKKKELTNKQNFLFHELSDNEKIIVNILKKIQKPAIDLIFKESKMTMAKVSATLLELEFKDVVRSLPGKIYEFIKI